MSTNNPPTFYFPNIDFNDSFYIPTSTGISLSYANANYLSRQGTATSIATSTTFNNSVTIGNTTITQSGNNLILTNGSNIALTLTNAANTSFLSGYSTQSYLNSISTGIMYLVGLSGTASGAYNLQTDSSGHLSFACGTNTLNIGTSGGANGNLNLYGQGVLTIPATTGTAISAPNGNISAATLTTTGDLIFAGTTNTINTSTLTGILNIQTMTGGSGYINFNPQNVNTFQVGLAAISSNVLHYMGGVVSMSATTPTITTASNGNFNISSQASTGGSIIISPRTLSTNQLTLSNAGIMTYGGNTINATNASTVNFGTATLDIGALGLTAATNTFITATASTADITIQTQPITGGGINLFPQSSSLNKLSIGSTGIMTYGGNTVTLTSAALNCGSQIYMTGTSINRTINNVFYNLNDSTTFSNDGRIYASGTFIFYEGLVNNGSHSFTTRDNVGVASTPLQITSAGVVILPPLNLTNNSFLPTTYSAIPTINQLGGSSQITFTAAQTVSTGTAKSLGSIITPAGGTYIINLSVSVVATAAVVLSRHVIEASTSNGAFINNMSQQQQYESITLASTNGQVWTTSYTIQVTGTTTIYGNVLLVFTGTMTGTGLISYTRIA